MSNFGHSNTGHSNGQANGVISLHQTHNGQKAEAEHGNKTGALTNTAVASIHDALGIVEQDDTDKWDVLAHRDELTMQNGKILVPTSVAPDYASVLHPTPWAVSQFCNRLRMPTAYYRRCPRELQDQQFNYWIRKADVGSEDNESEYSHLAKGAGHGYAHNGNGSYTSSHYNSPSRWLLRVKDDQLRGVLSDRYSKLDNKPLLETLEPLLPSRLEVKWFALTEESLHLRLVDPTLAREVLKDDRIMVGLHISNSEVGKKSVTVDAIIWRLVCSNGLIRLVKGKSLMQQKHIALSSYAMKRSLERAVGEALTTAAGLLEKMAESTQEYLGDVEVTIEQLATSWNLSGVMQQRIKDALLQEPASQQETIYGLTNAVTQAAQSLPPDQRYDMEVLAGKLMEGGVRVLLKNANRKGRSVVLNGSSTLSRHAVSPPHAMSPSHTVPSIVATPTVSAVSVVRPLNKTEETPPEEGARENNLEENNSSEKDSKRVFQHARQMFGGQVIARSRVVTAPNSVEEQNAVEAQSSVTRQNGKDVSSDNAISAAELASPTQSRPSADTSRFTDVRQGSSLSDTIARQRTASLNSTSSHTMPQAMAQVSEAAQAGPMVSNELRANTPRFSRSDEPSTTTQWDVIWAIADRRGLSSSDIQYLVLEHFDQDDSGMLTKAQALQLMQMLQQKPILELMAPESDEDDEEEVPNEVMLSKMKN